MTRKRKPAPPSVFSREPMTVPFLVRGTKLRGLTAEQCACGHEWRPYCVVAPTMGELFGGEG